MVFGVTKDDSVLHREIGQGYISMSSRVMNLLWAELYPGIHRGERHE